MVKDPHPAAGVDHLKVGHAPVPNLYGGMGTG
jgi:hypothetical protein